MKGICFDVDGILNQREPILKKARKEYCSNLGIDLTREEYVSNFVGNSETVGYLKKQYPHIVFDDYMQEVSRIENRIIQEEYNGSVPKRKGAEDAVKWFISHGFKLSAVSARTRDILEKKLTLCGMIQYFPGKYWSVREDVRDGNAKPLPDVYINSLDKMNLNPNQCLAFEDSLTGVISASSAGIRTIAMPTGYSDKQNFFPYAYVVIYGGWKVFACWRNLLLQRSD